MPCTIMLPQIFRKSMVSPPFFDEFYLYGMSHKTAPHGIGRLRNVNEKVPLLPQINRMRVCLRYFSSRIAA
ncbi:MAG TPA: hypothetical protein PLW97_13315, partial [Synergistaceae bacterium]|nr:hypothetical protein [Synergistaceae bacterium]